MFHRMRPTATQSTLSATARHSNWPASPRSGTITLELPDTQIRGRPSHSARLLGAPVSVSLKAVRARHAPLTGGATSEQAAINWATSSLVDLLRQTRIYLANFHCLNKVNSIGLSITVYFGSVHKSR